MKWARLFELFRHECRCNIASNESHSQRFTKLKCFCTTEFQEKHKTSKYKFTSYILTPHEQPHMQLCSCGGHNHHLSFQRHRGGASKWPAVFRLPFWWDPWISIFIPCPGAPSPWFCVKRHSTDPAWLVMMRTWRHVAFHVTFQRWNPTFFGSFWMKYDELILLNSKTN